MKRIEKPKKKREAFGGFPRALALGIEARVAVGDIEGELEGGKQCIRCAQAAAGRGTAVL
jgi:hypothetical protein